MPKLKVFVTPIGFHDAFVAAPSQKAALAAWGADVDLFARGSASLVTDDRLAEEPLASPGIVIRRLRGSEAEQIAAAERPAPATRARGRPAARSTSVTPQRALPPKPKMPSPPPVQRSPRPSRAMLDRAESALADAEERYRKEQRALADRTAELQRERRALRIAEEKEISRLERRRGEARSRYQDAVERWAAR